jgi:hypothetical protein
MGRVLNDAPKIEYIVMVSEVLSTFSPNFPEKPFWGHCLFDCDPISGFSCWIIFETKDWFHQTSPEFQTGFYSGVTPLETHSGPVTFFSASTPIFKGNFAIVPV